MATPIIKNPYLDDGIYPPHPRNFEVDTVLEQVPGIQTNITGIQNSLGLVVGDVSDLQSWRLTVDGYDIPQILIDVADHETRVDNIETEQVTQDTRLDDHVMRISLLEGAAFNGTVDFSPITNRLDDLEAFEVDADSDIMALQNDLTQAQSDITDLENGLTSAEADINNLETEDLNLNSAISAINVEQNTQNTAIGNNASNISSLSSDLTSTNNNVSSNLSAINANSSSISSNASAIGALDTRVASNETDVTSIFSQINGFNTNFNALQSSINTNSSNISSNLNGINSNANGILINSNNIQSLSTSQALLSNRVTINQNDIGTLQTDFSQLDNNVSSLSTSFSSLQSNVNAFNSRITQNENNVGTLQTGLSSLTSAVTTNTNDIGDNTSNISTIQSLISNLQSKDSSLDNDIVNVNSAIASNLSLIQDNADDILINYGLIQDAESDLGSLEARVIAIENNPETVVGLDNRLFAVENTTTALQNDISGFSSDITALQNSQATQDNNITSLSNDFTSLENDVTQLGTTVGSLSSLVSTNTAGVSNNLTLIGQANSAISANSTSIGDNEQDIANLTTSLSNLSQGVINLTTEVTANDADILALQNGQTSQDNSISNLQGTVSTNTSSINSLNTSVGNNTAAISSNDSDITALQNSVSSAVSSINTNTSSISDLATRVTDNEDDIGALDVRLDSAESSVLANQGNITSLLAASHAAVTPANASVEVSGTQAINVKLDTVKPFNALTLSTDGLHVQRSTGIAAFSSTLSNGAVEESRNLTATKGGTGVYNYTFVDPLPNALYAVTATACNLSPAIFTDFSAVVSNKSATGFTVTIVTGDNGGTPDAPVDQPHCLAVFSNSVLELPNSFSSSDDVAEGTTNLYFTETRLSSSPTIGNLQTSLANVNTDVSNLTSTVNGVSTDLSNLTTVVNGNSTDISSLQSDVSTLNGQSHAAVTLSSNDNSILSLSGQALTFNASSIVENGDNITLLNNNASYQTLTQVNNAITTAIDNLIDSAPGTFDTLNELATALQDNDSDIAAIVAVNTQQNTSISNLQANSHQAASSGNNAVSVSGTQAISLVVSPDTGNQVNINGNGVFVAPQDSVTRNSSGTDLTQNFNTTNAAGLIPSFSTIALAPANGSFITTAQTIQTTYTGRVRIEACIPFFSTGQRASLEGWLVKNGTKISARGNDYIRAASGDNRGYFVLTRTIDCVAGDNFQVRLKRETGSSVTQAINLDDFPTFEATRINVN